MMTRRLKAQVLLLSLSLSALSSVTGDRSLLQTPSNTQINFNPVTITVNQDPYSVIAVPITPSLPYSQAAYQCNVTGDIRIPSAGGTFPLTVKVSRGKLVRVIFANGNLNSQTVTAVGEPGIIVQQPIVQQSSTATIQQPPSTPPAPQPPTDTRLPVLPTPPAGTPTPAPAPAPTPGPGPGPGPAVTPGPAVPPLIVPPVPATPPSIPPAVLPPAPPPSQLTRTTAGDIYLNQLGGASPFIQAVGSPVLPTNAPPSVLSFQQSPTSQGNSNLPQPAQTATAPPLFPGTGGAGALPAGQTPPASDGGNSPPSTPGNPPPAGGGNQPPATPTSPTVPANPGPPTEPATPGTPTVTATPGTPTVPATPVPPTVPAIPVPPTVPATPLPTLTPDQQAIATQVGQNIGQNFGPPGQFVQNAVNNGGNIDQSQVPNLSDIQAGGVQNAANILSSNGINSQLASGILSNSSIGGRRLLQDTVPGGPNNGLVEYIALAGTSGAPGFVVPNTQFGVPYVEYTVPADAPAGQTASFRGVLEVAQVIGGVPQFPFRPNPQLSPECQVNVNFVVE